MAFDGITVANLRRDMAQVMTDARINRIIQPEPDALLLTFKGREGQGRLFMSASASLPLLYLTDENRTAPVTAPNFCMLLRKHIGSGRIISVSQPSLERIIFIDIEHYDEMGDLRRKRLVIELMGKHSNIIFCDDHDMIIDSIKHIPSQMSSVREVLPGRPYFIPVTQEKKDPLKTDREEFEQVVLTKAMPLSKAIYTGYTGISPVIAEELCYRAGLDGAESAQAVSNDHDSAGLWAAFDTCMNEIREGRFTPVIITDEKGRPVEFASVRLTMYSDLQARTGESISQILYSFYSMKDVYVKRAEGDPDLIEITVVGESFLYNMVRIMAGTLVYVGQGKMTRGEIEKLLTGEGVRKEAGKTMPAKGLTLEEVFYEDLTW